MNNLTAAWTACEVSKFESVAYVLRSAVDADVCVALDEDGKFDIVEIEQRRRLTLAESPFNADDSYQFDVIWEASS